MKKITTMAALAFGLMLTAPAHAIDFAAPIMQIDGKTEARQDVTTPGDQKGPILTLGTIAENALLGEYRDEQIDGSEKSRRFWLAHKIHEQRKDPVLTADDIALIKKLVAKAYPPLTVGQAWALLDPASVPK